MTFEKYVEEVSTLTTFVTHYCTDKHTTVAKKNRVISLEYNGESTTPLQAEICGECANIIAYGITRLQSCPYDDKPKCRKCEDPCYDRPQWKKVAAIMSYSGVKLGLTRIKNRIRFWH
jgi:hypothetical protein